MRVVAKRYALPAGGLVTVAIAAMLLLPGAVPGIQVPRTLDPDFEPEVDETAPPAFDIVGVTGVGERRLEGLQVTVRPLGPVGLQGLLVKVATEDRHRWMGFAAMPGPGTFAVTVLRDLDGSWQRGLTLDEHDLVRLDLDLTRGANDFLLKAERPFMLKVVPEAGGPALLQLTAPRVVDGVVALA
jgi:hypothetical protein